MYIETYAHNIIYRKLMLRKKRPNIDMVKFICYITLITLICYIFLFKKQ
jgi:hypothetical protein